MGSIPNVRSLDTHRVRLPGYGGNDKHTLSRCSRSFLFLFFLFAFRFSSYLHAGKF